MGILATLENAGFLANPAGMVLGKVLAMPRRRPNEATDSKTSIPGKMSQKTQRRGILVSPKD